MTNPTLNLKRALKSFPECKVYCYYWKCWAEFCTALRAHVRLGRLSAKKMQYATCLQQCLPHPDLFPEVFMFMQVSLTAEKRIQFSKRPHFLYHSVSFGLPAEIVKQKVSGEVNEIFC